MGYGFRVEAGRVLDRIEAQAKSEGKEVSNALPGNIDGFYEITRRDQPDGGIKGVCGKAVGKKNDDIFYCKPLGGFSISGNGKIIRFPGIPKKDWPKYEVPVTGLEFIPRA